LLPLSAVSVVAADTYLGCETTGSEQWNITTDYVYAAFTPGANKIDAIKACKYVTGFCYTQITDVEQEKNGIFFYDRRPKFDNARIKAIFEKIPSVIENPQDLSDWK
ncbi:MAG: hypothetical protein IIW69_08260, partial [Bacteroidaceae bacterium]|nr:hypothetical protein [Bacteroidaceae bacterium]